MADTIDQPTEVTWHCMALSYPHCSAEEIKSVAEMALAYDPSAYFRACDDVLYVHWHTLDAR